MGISIRIQMNRFWLDKYFSYSLGPAASVAEGNNRPKAVFATGS